MNQEKKEMDILKIPRGELGRRSSIEIEILDSDIDVINDFSRTMAQIIRKNNEEQRPTTFILPVGPVGQYRRLARICNQERISCKNLLILNMDEYCTDEGELIPEDHPLSFRAYMRKKFFQILHEDLRINRESIIFPNPHDLEATEKKIEELGGIQACFGGIGITGHLAFNEPPEDGSDVSLDEFRNTTTRVIRIARETQTINSVTCASGDIEAIPCRAVTLGMKHILNSERIFIYLTRSWQSAVVRRVLHGPVTPTCPASLLQTHPRAKIIMAACVAEVPKLGIG